LKLKGIIILFIAFWLAACQRQPQPVVAPWGETVGAATEATDDEDFDLDDIEHSGELIALCISGPDTYYDYHGQTLGLHAMLCQQLADSLGVRLRIEVCKDTAQLLQRLASGDADFTVHLWDKLHDKFYQQAGGDDVMVKAGDIMPGVLQGYLIDKKTAEAHNIKYITDLKLLGLL
jgi:hypothetical protein